MKYTVRNDKKKDYCNKNRFKLYYNSARNFMEFANEYNKRMFCCA